MKALFLLALTALYVFAVWGRGVVLTADSPTYLDPADSLLKEGRFWSDDPIAVAVPPNSFPMTGRGPTTIRTPVYPALIALAESLGGSLEEVVLLQHALTLLAAMLVYLVLRKEHSEIAGIAAAAAFAFHPAVLDSAASVMTESLCASLIAGATVALWASLRAGANSRFAALSGVLFGLAILTRPIAIFLPPALLLWIVGDRKRWRVAIVFALTSSVLPAAWIWRNHRVSGVATISSIGGENLLIDRAAGALVVADEPWPSAIFALQRQMGFNQPALKLRTVLVRQALTHNGRFDPEANHAQRSVRYAALAKKILREHPAAVAKITTSAVIVLMIDDLSFTAASAGVCRLAACRILFIPISIAIVLCVAVGCLTLIRRAPAFGWPVTIAILYFIVFSTGPGTSVRFVVPYWPLYAAAAGTGAAELWSRWSRSKLESAHAGHPVS